MILHVDGPSLVRRRPAYCPKDPLRLAPKETLSEVGVLLLDSFP